MEYVRGVEFVRVECVRSRVCEGWRVECVRVMHEVQRVYYAQTLTRYSMQSL